MNKGYYFIVRNNGTYFSKHITKNMNHWVSDKKDARKFRELRCALDCIDNYDLNNVEVVKYD